MEPGVYSIVDPNPRTCVICARIESGCDASGCATTFYATGGTIFVTALDRAAGTIAGEFTDAVLEQVEIGPSYCLDHYEFSVEPCTPACAAGSCAVDDGCGGTCACADPEVCNPQTNACECAPACNGVCNVGDGCGGTCPCNVDFCVLEPPLAIDVEAGALVATSGRLLSVGLTDRSPSVDPDPVLRGQAGYGAPGSVADGTWTWTAAVPDARWNDAGGGAPGQDRYVAQLPSPAPGVYAVAWRFSADGGRSWTYCDAAPGSADGYQIDRGARLTSRTPCRDLPTFEAVEVSCDGLDNDCDGDADEPCEVCGVDADDDGTPDCIEIELGTDPLDADSVSTLFAYAGQTPRAVRLAAPETPMCTGIAPIRVVRLSDEFDNFSVARPVTATFEEGP